VRLSLDDLEQRSHHCPEPVSNSVCGRGGRPGATRSGDVIPLSRHSRRLADRVGYRAVARTQRPRLWKLALHRRLRSTESNFEVRASQQISKRLPSEHEQCIRIPTERSDTQLFVQAQPDLSAKLIGRWLRRHATTCASGQFRRAQMPRLAQGNVLELHSMVANR